MDGEEFLAIDHKQYKLHSEMCVIADADRAVAIGGVMGGADSEVGEKCVVTANRLLVDCREKNFNVDALP